MSPTAGARSLAATVALLAALASGFSAAAQAVNARRHDAPAPTRARTQADRAGRQLHVHLGAAARISLTIATRGCEGHTLVVSVDRRVRSRSVIRGSQTRVLTQSFPAQEALLSVSSPRCRRAVHLSSVRLVVEKQESEANVLTPGISDASSAAAVTPAQGSSPASEEALATPPREAVATPPGKAVEPPPEAVEPPPEAVEPPPEAVEPPPEEGAEPPPEEGGSEGSGVRTITIATGVQAGYLNETDPRYRQTLIANFRGITPENEMKWETIEPASGVFDFGPAEQIVDFALAHKMTVHGHNLVWSTQLPTWLTSRSWTRAELMAVLHQHIEAVVSHFRGQVHEWDVVNEPLETNGTLEPDLWLSVIGPEYIALALRWAHEADPTAKLFINDYGIDWNGPKEQAMLQLATTLKNEGVPLDGIGMEEHLDLTFPPTEQEVEHAMSSYQALGLDVQVTEADVRTTGFQGTPEQAEEKQAEIFGYVARACRATPACSRFTVWGVSDAVSWLGAGAAALPFNSNYSPKRAWPAIQTGLANP
jgi:endo-1,4-beta-xylanase